MHVFRTLKGVTRRDRIRNTTIKTELKVEPLLDTIEKRSLQWYGHVMRMSDRGYPKGTFLWKPQGKRRITGIGKERYNIT